MIVKTLLDIFGDPAEGLEVIVDGRPIKEVRLNYVAGNLEIITADPPENNNEV